MTSGEVRTFKVDEQVARIACCTVHPPRLQRVDLPEAGADMEDSTAISVMGSVPLNSDGRTTVSPLLLEHLTVGPVEQMSSRVSGRRGHCQTNAGTNGHCSCSQLDLMAQRAAHTFGDLMGCRDVRNLRQHHDELVAADSGDEIERPNLGQETLRHDAQHPIANLVTMAVVDRLEAIQIDVDNRSTSAVCHLAKSFAEPFQEASTFHKLVSGSWVAACSNRRRCRRSSSATC